MPEKCIIKETPDSEPCGEPSTDTLVTRYSFESGPNFEMTLHPCADHTQRLIERYRTEFSRPI